MTIIYQLKSTAINTRSTIPSNCNCNRRCNHFTSSTIDRAPQAMWRTENQTHHTSTKQRTFPGSVVGTGSCLVTKYGVIGVRYCTRERHPVQHSVIGVLTFDLGGRRYRMGGRRYSTLISSCVWLSFSPRMRRDLWASQLIDQSASWTKKSTVALYTTALIFRFECHTYLVSLSVW